MPTPPVLIGLIGQSVTRDDEGHRTYTVNWHVQTASYLDGPQVVLGNWLLPPVGAAYAIDNDYDPWAFCTPELTIAPHPDVTERDPCQDWIITQTFTTKPMYRCNTAEIGNPLLEPFKLSGDFVHEQRQASVDRFGDPLVHPNYQPITGPLVEYKHSYPSISIEFNSAVLPLSTYSLLINKVNDAPLWGFPARTVRFIDAKWERVLYGLCFYYYKTTYTFEVNLDTFDPLIPAEGTVALREGGDPNNPDDYGPVLDGETGEPKESMLLDSLGREVSKPEDQYIPQKQILKQGNLLLLGVPTSLF